jgi:NADH dehydrogenase [ubiquinone] 1 alpha subcomplex assembly factor 3
LSLFTVLEPKVDVLVIGIGDQSVTPELSQKLVKFMKRYDINVEVLPTEQACTTFNFLNSEGRMAAAAMIPPLVLQISEEDYARFSLQKQKILELDD